MSEIEETCPICHSEITDEIYSCCEYLHPYCFKCIIDYVKVNNKLTPCVLCRDSRCEYLCIPENRKIIKHQTQSQNQNQNQNGNQDISDEEYFSLKYFLKSLKLVRKIINCKYTYSSLITESEIKSFIKNKENIILFNKIIDNNLGTFDSIYSSIKWEKNDSNINMRTISLEGNEIFDIFNNMSNNPNQGMMDLFTYAISQPVSIQQTQQTQQTQQQTQRPQTRSQTSGSNLFRGFFN